jgi:hypothetical protein
MFSARISNLFTPLPAAHFLEQISDLLFEIAKIKVRHLTILRTDNIFSIRIEETECDGLMMNTKPLDIRIPMIIQDLNSLIHAVDGYNSYQRTFKKIANDAQREIYIDQEGSKKLNQQILHFQNVSAKLFYNYIKALMTEKNISTIECSIILNDLSKIFLKDNFSKFKNNYKNLDDFYHAVSLAHHAALPKGQKVNSKTDTQANALKTETNKLVKNLETLENTPLLDNTGFNTRYGAC